MYGSLAFCSLLNDVRAVGAVRPNGPSHGCVWGNWSAWPTVVQGVWEVHPVVETEGAEREPGIDAERSAVSGAVCRPHEGVA